VPATGYGTATGDTGGTAVGWRDGCEARPEAAEGAHAVVFDFAAADMLGHRLHVLRRSARAHLAARADAAVLLTDWTGAHRATFDAERAAHERALAGNDLDVELRRLRAAWDEAARAQARANRSAAQSDPSPHRPVRDSVPTRP